MLEDYFFNNYLKEPSGWNSQQSYVYSYNYKLPSNKRYCFTFYSKEAIVQSQVELPNVFLLMRFIKNELVICLEHSC